MRNIIKSNDITGGAAELVTGPGDPVSSLEVPVKGSKMDGRMDDGRMDGWSERCTADKGSIEIQRPSCNSSSLQPMSDPTAVQPIRKPREMFKQNRKQL